MPWQEVATEKIVELQGTDEEEYVVINVAPGSGKSSFFSLVLPAWVTCRQRHIRGMLGSASMSMAKQYVGELRDVLGNPLAIHQSPENIRTGQSVAPEGSLVDDFGVFRTEDRKWAADAFFVEQLGNAMFRAKEPTWQAFGRGTTFLGARVDLAVWDDVYDPEQMRTENAKEDLRRWWKDVAESRLEPGGLLVLQGQRLEADDIYRFALDQKRVTEIDGEGEAIGEVAKYHHIVFPAHDDDGCKGPEFHKRTSAPWHPDGSGGCLLFPRRLSWAKLRAERENNPNFDTVYQQRDTVAGGMLVDKLWVTGGRGGDGVDYPGCYDLDRGLCELPEGLTPPWLSIVSADPSPTQFWSIQWWVYHPATQQRFFMDMVRRRMTAPLLLDYNRGTGRFSGIVDEWQARSRLLGFPISHWIVEKNGANQFLLQYNHVKDWLRVNSVKLVPHETQRNKTDPKYGVTSLAPHWKFGRVRIPAREGDPGRASAAQLVSEVTRYRLDGRPSGTDDCVMAEWFFEWNLPRIERSWMDVSGFVDSPHIPPYLMERRELVDLTTGIRTSVA